MAAIDTSFEMGSNLSENIGFIGMENFKAKLKSLYDDLSGKGLHDALYAGAEIFRIAIESASPVGKAYYTYTYTEGRYKGRTIRVKAKHLPGQARDNVIVYQRKGYLMQTAEQLSLLIGYRKKKAYYMYWYEYGTAKQAAHPFMRAAYDGAWDAALEAAGAVLTDHVARAD